MTLSKNNVGKPVLGDIAKDFESCSREICSALDDVIGSVNTRSCGIGIIAMKQAASIFCSVISDRLNKVLSTIMNRNTKSSSVHHEHSEDEWTTLGGALRLLMAASRLKRAWNTHKESALAVTIGCATPMLELANAVKTNGANGSKDAGGSG